MDWEWTFCILGKPVSSKNAKRVFYRGSKPFIGTEPRVAAWFKSALWQLTSSKKPKEPLDYPLHIKTLIYLPDKRRRDLTNLLQAPEDALTKAGIIKDDSLIDSVDGSRKLLDRDDPRVEIFIKEFEK